MLKAALAEIDLDTLDSYQFKFNSKIIKIQMIGTVVILNSLGDWKDFVALNITTMMNIMQKDSLSTLDMGMCFPHKGVGYSIKVVIENDAPLLSEVATERFVEILPDVENKTVSRRGRKGKSDV